MRISLALATVIALVAPLFAQEKPLPIPVVKDPPVLPSRIVAIAEAEKLIAETPGLIVLDVRSPEEFEQQHIKGAVNANVHDPEFLKTVLALDQTRPILIHCASGNRSGTALLSLAGKVKFPQVLHMNEGIVGWKKAGKPLETKPLPGAGRVRPLPGKKAEEKK